MQGYTLICLSIHMIMNIIWLFTVLTITNKAAMNMKRKIKEIMLEKKAIGVQYGFCRGGNE